MKLESSFVWIQSALIFKKVVTFLSQLYKIRKKATTNLPFTKNNVFSCIMRISFHNLHIPFEWPYCAFSTHDMHHSFQGKPVFFRILTVCQNSKNALHEIQLLLLTIWWNELVSSMLCQYRENLYAQFYGRIINDSSLQYRPQKSVPGEINSKDGR